jgi:hypothetical protein
MHFTRFTALSAAICLGVSVASAATYYLSPNGSDSTGNGSSTSPWRSFSAVAANVPARQGHTVRLLPGLYYQDTSIWLPTGITLEGESSTSDPNRTIVFCRHGSSWPGTTLNWSSGNAETYPTVVKNVTFDGDNFTGYGGLDFRRHSNVTIQDCFFRNFGDGPLSIKLAEDPPKPLESEWMTGIKILRCYFNNNKARAIMGNGWRNFEIGYCGINNPDKPGATFDDPTLLGDGIQIYYSEGGRIHNNSITVPNYIPFEPRWPQQRSAPTITVLHGGKGLEVDNNYLNQWTSFVFDPNTGTQTNLDFHHNLMVQSADVPGEAIEIMWNNTFIRDNTFINFAFVVLTDAGSPTYQLCKNIHVFRNAMRRTMPMTVYETAGVVIRNNKESDLEDFYVYNNVIDGMLHAFRVDGGGKITSMYVKNNAILNCGYVFCWNWPQQTNITTFEVANNAWHYTQGFEKNPRAASVQLGANYPRVGESLPAASSLGLLLSGDIPYPYYLPSSSTAYVVDKGTTRIGPNYSLGSYSGLAPDVGIFDLAATASGTGLKGTYFAGVSLSGTPMLTRTDDTVNFSWNSGSYSSGGLTDNFSVRWEGEVKATTAGTYTFSTYSDDGVRVWVNGVQVINNWTDHAATWNTSAGISLTAGQKVSIKMEYYERTGGATAQLHWTPPGGTRQVVPKSQLFPAP